MNSLIIKMILDEHGIENSENLSKALAKVLDRFATDSSIASELSKSIKEHDRRMNRMRGINY